MYKMTQLYVLGVSHAETSRSYEDPPCSRSFTFLSKRNRSRLWWVWEILQAWNEMVVSARQGYMRILLATEYPT